jgi:hypothetical protein
MLLKVDAHRLGAERADKPFSAVRNGKMQIRKRGEIGLPTGCAQDQGLIVLMMEIYPGIG